MYRKHNGSLGFSFTRIVNADIPNLVADVSATHTTDLAPLRRDMIYMHQLASPNIYAFDQHIFYVAGIVDDERTSKQTFKVLTRHGVLRADGTVDTLQIGPRFTHQIAILSHHSQKHLI